MGKRKRIALVFSYDENWIGGTYYIQNLISALKSLPVDSMPEITICSTQKKDFDYLLSVVDYPFLNFFNITFSAPRPSVFVRVLNRAGRLFFGRNLIKDKKATALQLPDHYDLVFPNPWGYAFRQIPEIKKIFWIPDFQEDHLPGFFTRQELADRKTSQLQLAILTENVVLSSKSAQADFNRLYPFAFCEQFVLPFAVTHPPYDEINIEELKNKYNIKGDYFYCPNQFWAHKNHKLLLEAALNLKHKGCDITVVFSGKEQDYRNPDHIKELKKYVSDNSMQAQILFLGFIDRKDQLALMKNALCVIQPSLFEGWSTVIEDAKAMNQFVLASDLPVHKEQLRQNVLFFDPYDSNSLAGSICKVLEGGIEKKDNNYSKSVRDFGDGFMKIIENVEKRS